MTLPAVDAWKAVLRWRRVSCMAFESTLYSESRSKRTCAWPALFAPLPVMLRTFQVANTSSIDRATTLTVERFIRAYALVDRRAGLSRRLSLSSCLMHRSWGTLCPRVFPACSARGSAGCIHAPTSTESSSTRTLLHATGVMATVHSALLVVRSLSCAGRLLRSSP